MAKAKQQELSTKEKLEQALLPEDEQPYEVPSNWVWCYFNSVVINHDSSRVPLSQSQRESMEKIYDYYGASGIIDKVENFIFDKKLMLIGEDGANLVTRSKPIAFIAEGKYWVNNHAHVLESKVCILLEYLCNYINSINLVPYVTGSAQPKMTQDKMNIIPVPLAPLAEQQRIVDRIESLFEKLDNAKELAQNALDTFETRKAAILHKAFTGELTAHWREKNGVGMDSWSLKLLKDTDIEIIDGDRGVNYPKKEEFFSEGYCLFLNAKNVTKNGFVFEEMQFITESKDQILRKGRLERGDVVLTTRGTIGNIAYYNDSVPFEHMRINSGMVIYRGGKEFYKPYLCYLYKSNYILSQISSIQTGSAQPQLPIKIMKELKLPIPSYNEQQKIVRILDSLFEKEEKAKEICDVIDKIDLMKKAILARAFRGELCTNDPSEDSAVELLSSIL